MDPSTLTERTVLDVTPDGLGTLRSRGTEQLFVEDRRHPDGQLVELVVNVGVANVNNRVSESFWAEHET